MTGKCVGTCNRNMCSVHHKDVYVNITGKCVGACNRKMCRCVTARHTGVQQEGVLVCNRKAYACATGRCVGRCVGAKQVGVCHRKEMYRCESQEGVGV